jgi:hypothetical protein
MFPLEASAFVPGEGTSSTQAIAKPGFRDGPPCLFRRTRALWRQAFRPANAAVISAWFRIERTGFRARNCASRRNKGALTSAGWRVPTGGLSAAVSHNQEPGFSAEN